MYRFNICTLQMKMITAGVHLCACCAYCRGFCRLNYAIRHATLFRYLFGTIGSPIGRLFRWISYLNNTI